MIETLCACAYCGTATHTWNTPEETRICFNCLRSQRDEYRSLAQRQAYEIAGLEEQVKNLQGELHNPTLCDGNAAGRFINLRADLKSLHEATGRLLAALEKQP